MISQINIMICAGSCDATAFIHWLQVQNNQITLLEIYIAQICSHSLVYLFQAERLTT